MWCKVIIFFAENQENFLFLYEIRVFVCVNTKTALSLDCKNAAFSYKL